MMDAKNPTPTQILQRLYNEAYFHGEGSGYSCKGYESEHADWSSLIQFVRRHYGDSLYWLDVGCAYGYLIEQAARIGVKAFGVDISAYALRQLPKVRNNLVQAHATELPFPNASFHAVSLFDVIEHLQNPEMMLREVKRVLHPTGLCFLSTPDPIHFHRREPTHFYERPPAFWIALLKQMGFAVGLRFGKQPYELEIVATPTMNERFHQIQAEFPYIDAPKEVELTAGESILAARRSAFSSALSGAAMFYLLNSSPNPIRATIRIQTAEAKHPDLFIADLKLRYRETQQADSLYIHHWDPVSLPPGGRDLTLQNAGEPLHLHRIEVAAEPVERERFLLELPFDHYQRYRLVAEVLSHLRQVNNFNPQERTVLDVGGVLGYLPLFAPQMKVQCADVVWEDAPQTVQYSGHRLPYADEAFDYVVSVDTLEHVPQEQRENFLNEICRTAKEAVIICGPYDEPNVFDTEEIIRNFAQNQWEVHNRFLEEHALYSLPDRSSVRKILARNGFSVTEIPNGYLPRWLCMQLLNFLLGTSPELWEGKARLNALYNEHYYAYDNNFPSYRILAAATRKPSPPEFKSLLSKSSSPEDAARETAVWSIASIITALSSLGVIREKETAVAQQNTRLENLIQHLQNLEKAVQQEQELRLALQRHADNLEELVKKKEDHFQALERHGDNLVHLLEEQRQDRENHQILLQNQQKHIANLDQIQAERENVIAGLQQHIRNLDAQRQELDRHSLKLVEHAEQLVAARTSDLEIAEGWRRHSENLQLQISQHLQHMQNLTAHIANVERNADEWKNHAKNLESMSASLQTHAGNLETLLREKDRHIQNLEMILQEKDRLRERLQERLATQEKEQRLITDSILELLQTFQKPLHPVFAPEETCKNLAAALNIPLTSPLTAHCIQITAALAAAFVEKERSQKFQEILQSNYWFKLLAHIGLLPSIKEPADG